MTQTYRTITNA